MQFIFFDCYYDHEDEFDGRNFKVDLFNKLKDYDNNLSFREVNVGLGADSPAILVEIFQNITILHAIEALAAIFYLAEKGDKELSIIANKVKNIIKFIKKNKPDRIDRDVAACIAVDHFMEKYKERDKLNVTVQVVAFNEIPWESDSLARTPDALYVITVENLDSVGVYGIKSSGSIEFTKFYNTKSFYVF